MTDTMLPPPSSSPGDGAAGGDDERPSITFIVTARDDIRLIEIAGELDIAGFDRVFRHCTEGRSREVLVDLADLTFMDCGGYRAFVASQAELALQDRTLALVDAVGEPRRLLDLIQQTDTRAPSC